MVEQLIAADLEVAGILHVDSYLKPMDLLRWPGIGRFLRWRHGRLVGDTGQHGRHVEGAARRRASGHDLRAHQRERKKRRLCQRRVSTR